VIASGDSVAGRDPRQTTRSNWRRVRGLRDARRNKNYRFCGEVKGIPRVLFVKSGAIENRRVSSAISYN
jgi:hypothetical protein